MAWYGAIQVFISTRIIKKKRKKWNEKGKDKWMQRELFPLIIQIAAWCSTSPLQPPSQKHQPDKVRTWWILPAVGIHLNHDAAKQLAIAKAPWPKIIRIAHRGIPAKKISATRKLHLSIKPLPQIHIIFFSSQEIVRCPSSYIWLSPPWGRLKLQNNA
jgi:hypothetical protein